jgi:hypothetical protein
MLDLRIDEALAQSNSEAQKMSKEMRELFNDCPNLKHLHVTLWSPFWGTPPGRADAL